MIRQSLGAQEIHREIHTKVDAPALVIQTALGTPPAVEIQTKREAPTRGASMPVAERAGLRRSFGEAPAAPQKALGAALVRMQVRVDEPTFGFQKSFDAPAYVGFQRVTEVAALPVDIGTGFLPILLSKLAAAAMSSSRNSRRHLHLTYFEPVEALERLWYCASACLLAEQQAWS